MTEDAAVNPSLVRIVELIASRRAGFSLESLPPLPHQDEDAILGPGNPEVAANLVEVEPASLDELKLLIGVPDDAIDREKHSVELKLVDEALLPSEPFTYDALDEEVQSAVDAAAFNLLFGQAPPEGRMAHVERYLLDTMNPLVVLAASNLDVPSGTVKRIQTPTAIFNTITIHGTGQIELDVDVKFTANLVQHVA